MDAVKGENGAERIGRLVDSDRIGAECEGVEALIGDGKLDGKVNGG